MKLIILFFLMQACSRSKEICKYEMYNNLETSEYKKYNIDNALTVLFRKKTLFKTSKLKIIHIIKMATHSKIKKIYIEFDGKEVQEISALQDDEVIAILLHEGVDKNSIDKILNIITTIKECENQPKNKSVF
ncbi:MAG: hypothetical protein RLZZ546_2322 [Bacteroidota bacterium]